MPVILKNFSDNNSISGIWEIAETEEELRSICDLTDYDILILSNSQSLKRRKEILAARALIKALDLNISIKYNGRKPVSNKGNISISHTCCLVSVIWHPYLRTTIDIEQLREKILRVAERVFSKEELSFADSDIKKLTLLWNSKECIFKIADNDDIEFKTQIKVSPLSKGHKIICELYNNNNTSSFELNWLELKDHSCVWGII